MAVANPCPTTKDCPPLVSAGEGVGYSSGWMIRIESPFGLFRIAGF